jgi:hypothetical protein
MQDPNYVTSLTDQYLLISQENSKSSSGSSPTSSIASLVA